MTTHEADIKIAVEKLIAARKRKADAVAAEKAIYDAHQGVFDAAADAKKAVSKLERELRQLAQTAINDGGNIEPLTEKTESVVIYDPRTVVAWAMEHNMPSLLSPNATLFERLFRETPMLFGGVYYLEGGDFAVGEWQCVEKRKPVIPRKLKGE